jgi:hypothetical protein
LARRAADPNGKQISNSRYIGTMPTLDLLTLEVQRPIALFASAAAPLIKTFAMQVEVFRRLRHGGQQFVRVEHVSDIGVAGEQMIAMFAAVKMRSNSRLKY